MTLTGLILIPIALVAIFMPWRYCLIALLVFSPLSAAAVVNAGNFGLQPGYFFGLLVVARTFTEMLIGQASLNSFVLRRLLPLGGLLLVSIVALWSAVMFFQGEIDVITGTQAFNLLLAQPYRFARENQTQLAYLIFNVTLVYCLGHQAARMPLDEVLGATDRALVISILFTGAAIIWQMLSYYGGVYFPKDFFISNAGYDTGSTQEFGELLRVAGPFAEPSSLAYYFSGYLFFAWQRYRRLPTVLSMGLVLLCLFCLAVSTSTTAYAVLAAFGLVLGKDMLLGIGAIATRRFRFSSGKLLALTVMVVGIVAAVVYISENWAVIDRVLTAAVYEKQETSSYVQRSGVDRMALNITVETGGLGLGLGSHKPNSLLMTLLSNTGVLGTILFMMFAWSTLKPVRLMPPGEMPQTALNAAPFQWLTLGMLLVHAFSNPNLSFVQLWISFGLVLGILASARMTAFQLRRTGSEAGIYGLG